MPILELSSEANDNSPNRPKKDTLKRRYKEEFWEQLRDAYRSNHPVDPNQLIDPDDAANLKAALLLPPGAQVMSAIDQYSPDLPDHLQERYRQATLDPDLMAMRQDIAIMRSLIGNCLNRMKVGGESGKVWKEVKEQAKAVLDAQGDPIKAKATLTKLLKTITRGSPFVELQQELLLLMKERSNLIKKESERLEKLQQYAPRQDVHELFRAFAEIVKEEVKDKETLKRIGDKVRKLRLG